MAKNVSGTIAAKSGGKRIKTRFPGVYSRKILNKRTSKPDTAFDICYRTQEGKLRWEVIGYASDGVNAAYANGRRGAILDGISKGEKPKRKRDRNGITFGAGWELFKERWLPNLARPQDEINRYTYYLEDALAHRRMDTITLLDLEDLKQRLLKQGFAPATVRLALSDVRRMYRKLTAWGAYDGPIPTEGLVMPKVDNARTRFLTREEAIRLLEAVKKRSTTWYGIAFLSLYTGMRKKEVLGLRCEHLDFGARQILIKDAKTGSRSVPMTDDVAIFLKSLEPDTPDAFLFTRRGGGPHDIIRSDSDESFVRAVKDCGLNDKITDSRHKVVFHTLRHTYCSWLAMSGVPLYTISELVGHTTVQMTKRYSHLCPDTKHDAAAKIAAIMQDEGGE